MEMAHILTRPRRTATRTTSNDIPLRMLLAMLITSLLLGLQSAGAEEANPCSRCHDVDVAYFKGSPHGLTECLDCHVGADDRKHRRGLDPVDCGECHASLLAEHAVSAHGREDLQRSPGIELPACANCHGELHAMTPVHEPSSPVHASRQGETCGTCHGAGQPAPPGVHTIRPIEAYTASVHAALGRLYIRRNEPDKALRALDESLRLDPGQAVLQYTLGRLWLGDRPDRVIAWGQAGNVKVALVLEDRRGFVMTRHHQLHPNKAYTLSLALPI